MALPKVLYVYEDGEPGEKYFVASRDSHEQMQGEIGVYHLKRKLEVRHKPQFRRPGNKIWFDK